MTAVPAPPRSTLARWLRVPLFVLHQTFVQPIRDGRLTEVPEHPWPRGLRPLIWTATGLYALLALLALFATALRQTRLVGGAELSLPELAAPFVVLGVIVGLSLLYTAALHLVVWLRIPLVLLVICIAASGPALASPSSILISAVGSLALIAVMVWRWRRPFRALEFVVSLLIIGHLMVLQVMVPSLVGLPTPNWGTTVLGYWAGLVMVIATPATLLAGAAKTEIVVTIGSWTARGVWEAVMPLRRARLVGGLLLGLLVVGSVAHEAYLFLTNPLHPLSELPAALLLLAICGLVAGFVLRWAPLGRRPGIPVDPDDVAHHWSVASWPLAFLLAGAFMAPNMITLLTSAAGQNVSLELSRGFVSIGVLGVGVLLLAVWQTRRGRTSAALVSAALGTSSIVVHLLLRWGQAINSNTTLSAAVLVAVLALAYLLVRGRLTSDRGLALATVLVLSQVYPLREKIEDPLVAIFAASGTSATLLVGLLWRQVTEYARARGDSPAFPNSSRVLLSLANMMLVATSISLFALSAEVGGFDLETIESLGDSELGGALLTGSLLAGLLLALRGREGGDQQAGEEFSLEPFVLVEPKNPFVGFLEPPSLPRRRGD